MKFGSGLGWTRDFDNPHKDDEDPHKGVLAEFFERVFHKHNERGEKLNPPRLALVMYKQANW